MVTLNCPWCEEPVGLGAADVVRCDGCSVELELEFAPEARSEVALAA